MDAHGNERCHKCPNELDVASHIGHKNFKIEEPSKEPRKIPRKGPQEKESVLSIGRYRRP